MCNRKSTWNSFCLTLFYKGHCVVPDYSNHYYRAIFFFKETSALGPINVIVTSQRYECLLCNHVIPALQQHGWVNWIIFMKMMLLRTMQIQWSSCWSDILDMLELSTVIFLQPGNADHLFLIRMTGYGAIWKILCSVFQIEGTHCATHSKRDTGDIEINCWTWRFLYKMVNSTLNILQESPNIQNQLDGCLFCGFWSQNN